MGHVLVAGFVMMNLMFQRHISAATQDLKHAIEQIITAVGGLAGAGVAIDRHSE